MYHDSPPDCAVETKESTIEQSLARLFSSIEKIEGKVFFSANKVAGTPSARAEAESKLSSYRNAIDEAADRLNGIYYSLSVMA